MAPAPTASSPNGRNRVATPPLVEPQVESEPPSFAKLSAIIAVCFGVGVAWPLLGGLSFVQRPPGSAPAKAPDAEGTAAPAEPALASATAASFDGAPAPSDRQSVRIEGHVVQSCRGDAGERIARCDEPELDIEDTLAQLAGCADAKGLSGLLSLGLELDFSRARVARLEAGQSTTLSRDQAAGVIACAERLLGGAPLDDIEHEHARYWIYYRVRFVPPGRPGAARAEDAVPDQQIVIASGQATVGYQTALVREAASARAQVVTSLPQGTRVSVTGRLGEWYRIERAGKKLGWVHRNAIGM